MRGVKFEFDVVRCFHNLSQDLGYAESIYYQQDLDQPANVIPRIEAAIAKLAQTPPDESIIVIGEVS